MVAESAVLVLTTVELNNVLGAQTVPGAEEIVADCGHLCIIAPSSKLLLLDPDYEITTRCIRCSMELAERGGLDDAPTRSVPGADEDFAAAGLDAKDIQDVKQIQQIMNQPGGFAALLRATSEAAKRLEKNDG